MLRGRDFRRLYATRLASQTGDGVFEAALASLFFFSPQRAATAPPSLGSTPSTFGSMLPGYSTPPPAPAPVKPYTPPPSVFQSVPKRNF